MIVSTSALVLPDGTPFRRAMLRPPAQRQPGYEEAYDSRTLFYDAFRHGDDVVLSGPPLLNLRRRFAAARFTSSGVQLAASLSDINRTQRSRASGGGDEVRIEAEGLDATLEVSPDGRHLFRDRRVLMAISRNNPLRWIADWARYYATIHEINAILLYDNGSDDYGLDELEAAISSVPGIETAVVVNWPFPFGPGAGPDGHWDADFCHASMFEHARFRFLGQAAQVINADIDELVVTADGRPLYEHLAASQSGGLSYFGRWIEGIRDDRPLSHAAFDHYDPASKPCPPKWTVRPAAVPLTAQWSIHRFAGWEPDRPATVRFGHFRQLTTNWKGDRRLKERNPETWLVDAELRRDLDRAFAQ